MKKTYMTPMTEMIDVKAKEQLLTVSGGWPFFETD